ncbi:helix-turn-helix transcriptional regulator [Delftia acidovorans]|uniref:helix-turn-helix domain-containing protein n=1 Tax=Delftia acidovorans TaxID=80866 RepID=UPI002FDD6CA1
MVVNKMNAEIRVIFGERLRQERERLGLSQADMAKLGGTKMRTFQDWERDVATVSAEFLARISAHGLDISFVLTGLRSFDPNAIQHERSEPTLAARLQQERQRLNLTEAELAHKAGLDKQTLKHFESGGLVPDATALKQLHLAGVDIGYVLLSLRSTPPDADVQALLEHYGKATPAGRALVRGVAELAGRG